MSNSLANQLEEMTAERDRLRNLLDLSHSISKTHCSQCGNEFETSACGPTHAQIHGIRKHVAALLSSEAPKAVVKESLTTDGWIKCIERMPPDRLLVLIFQPREGNNYYMKIDHRRDNKWDIEGNLPIYDQLKVTHWRPLPPAPTDDEWKGSL